MEEPKIELQSELYIDVNSSQINIALLHNKRLVELTKDQLNFEFGVGDIYLGKVTKLLPGLNAAFVDIGYKKDAFLHYLDLGPGFQTLNKFLHLGLSKKNKSTNIHKIKCEPDIDKNGKITDVLSVGQYVLVQIAKEPISTKGPRLTCEISIPGRYLVLMPYNKKNSVSQKIKSAEEKIRLKKLVESISPENYGVIVRTVAENKMVAELDKELHTLIQKWESLFAKLENAKPPQLLLSEMTRTTAILRDMLNSSFNQIVVNDENTYNEVLNFIEEIAPDKKKIVKLYSGKESLFDHYGITKQIKSSFGKTVPLGNGAYLIIEHTEAAHVIDVNSGNRSNSEQDQEANATEVNLIAAVEIARQLRLRDMGGIIVVDFIDIHDEKNRKKVYDTMKEAMEKDRAKFQLMPLSKFCLMEITRQRVRPEMQVTTSETCPTCQGTGKIWATINLIDEIENNLSFFIKKYKEKDLIIKVHPFVHAYLTKGLLDSIKKQWQKKYKCKLEILPDMAYTLMEYYFFKRENNEQLF